TVRGISADGKVILTSTGGGGRSDVSVLSRPSGTQRPVNLPNLTQTLALSPDGRWIAYAADPSPTDVFVRALPDDPKAPLPRVSAGSPRVRPPFDCCAGASTASSS